MIPDPNEEILANKRRLAAKFDNDLHRIAEDIRRRQAEGDREIVSLPPRRYAPKIAPKKSPQPAGAAISTSRDNLSLPAEADSSTFAPPTSPTTDDEGQTQCFR